MNASPTAAHDPDELRAYFRSGDAMRSRSVSPRVLSGAIELPPLPARLLSDWEREVSADLGLEPGDVEALSLPRARTRWRDYGHCVAALAEWARGFGLQEVLGASDVALMACRGARYHHDAERYGAAAFCNLFLCEDKGLDVCFPVTGQRIPLARGTAMIFDTGQPHALVPRGKQVFDAGDFAAAHDCTQVFLSWELPVENPFVAQALRIAFDIDPATASRLDEEQLRLGDAKAHVCPASGRWLAPD